MLMRDYQCNAEFWRTGRKARQVRIKGIGENAPRIMNGWSGRAFLFDPFCNNALEVGGRKFERGWGLWHLQPTYSARVELPKPAARVSFLVGMNDVIKSEGKRAKFLILDDGGRLLSESPELGYGETAPLNAELDGATTFLLQVAATAGRDICGDFIEPHIEYCDGAGEQPGLRQTEPAALQITFDYDGVPFDPNLWRHTMKEEKGNYFHYFYSPDEKLRLEVEARIHDEFHVIELIPTLSCVGDEPTGIVSNFCCPRFSKELFDIGHSGADLNDRLGSPLCQPAFKLHRILGSQATAEDFSFCETMVQNHYALKSCTTETNEGRSSAVWLPFFQLELVNDRQIEFAVGWSGEWKSEVGFISDTQFEVTAGLRETHFHLLPREAVRQPSCAVHFFVGPRADCSNEFRRFMLAKRLPRDAKGELLLPPVTLMFSGSLPNDVLLSSLALAEEKKLPFEVFWADAGWYGPDREVPPELMLGDWSTTTGDWRVNQVPHPGGFRPVTDALHRTGRRFLLWLEAERAHISAPAAKEHPEYFTAYQPSSRPLNLGNANADNLMLNLGNEEACRHVTELICEFIEKEGIDCYREDFNLNTIPYWEGQDAPDRIGIAEAKFVTGLYRFWSTLRKRFPDLLIDNCASGGRRIDLETCSLSLPLWRSDFQCFPDIPYLAEANQTHFHGLSAFIPFHCCGTELLKSGDDYTFLSGAFGSSIIDLCNRGHIEPEEDALNPVWLKKMLELAIRLRDYLPGSYDCLTPDPWDYRNFYAFELFRRDRQSGAAVIFRRKAVPADQLVLPLKYLTPDADYQVEDAEQELGTWSGRELAAHVWTLPTPRSVKVIFFSRAANAVGYNDYMAVRGGIARSLYKFSTKKQGTVAFLGGSITEMKGYVALTEANLEKLFPECRFNWINAGIGSTCSDTGAFRLKSHILDRGIPDLLLVEFAVNDNQDGHFAPQHSRRAMEGIVRTMKAANPEADIIFLYTINDSHLKSYAPQAEEAATCEDAAPAGETPREIAAHEEVAAHYRLPSLNFAADVAARIRHGEFDWATFGGTHPAPFGHAIFGEVIRCFLRAQQEALTAAAPPRAAETLPPPLDSFHYANARLVPARSLRLLANTGWRIGVPEWAKVPGNKRKRYLRCANLYAGQPGAEVKLAFSGRLAALWITAGIDAGTIEYRIDAGEWQTRDLFYRDYSRELHYPYSAVLADELAPGRHTLTMRISAQHHACSQGHAVRIMALAVARDGKQGDFSKMKKA